MTYVYFTNGAQGPSSDQVFDLLVQLLPRGAAKFYGLARKAGDVWNYFMGISETMKVFAFDAIATLRAEINPNTAYYKLGDYEQWLGLAQTPVAISGTVAQRRAQIISKLREQGAATVNNVQAILAPLLGYSNASQLKIIEADRGALFNAHAYNNFTGASIGSNSSVTQTVYVSDDGSVSDAGAQLYLVITSTNPEQISVTLTGPSASGGGTGAGQFTYTFQAGSLPAGSIAGSPSLQLNELTLSPGKYITGTWTMQINTGAAACTLTSWSLFVEGGGSRDAAGNSGLGEQMHDWIVQYDPNIGSNPNFPAARAALQRIAPADSNVVLVNGTTARCSQSLYGPFVCNTV